MMVAMRHNPSDAAEVRRLLAIREAEGLTFRELSGRFGIAVHVLAYRAHRDHLAARGKRARRSKFVEVVAEPEPEPEADQHEAQGERSRTGIELQLPGGLRVQLFRDFDEDALVRLLSIVPC